MYFEIEEFVRIKGESSYALGRRFELFCCELLARYFEELGAIVTHTGASSDGGRDIIVDMDGYRFVVQCREEADAFLTVVRRGNFDFGILVGVLEQKIAKGAYDAADESGGDIIVTLYTRMCQDIKRLIAGRLTEQIRILENRNRLFILNYNLIYYSFSVT
ncbi:9281_t:CDS:2, partial [Cetraspora pellucida]